MKDKNKFTLKIVLVIALAVALIATLISCCVLATKGKLSTQASCDNNQTAFANERPDLDCYATAASNLETDFITISQANTTDIYYGVYVPNNEKNKNVALAIGGESGLFSLISKTDDTILYQLRYLYGVENGESNTSRKLKLYKGANFYSYLAVFGSFDNEFIYLDGFRITYPSSYARNMDIYLRTVPLVSGGDISLLQGQIDTLTAEKAALQKQVNDLTAEKTALQKQVTEKQNKINTLTAEKAALQKQVSDLTAEKTALQTQVNNLTAEKTALQTQVNNLTAEKTALQAQITDYQTQINSLTAQKTALQNKVNDLTAKNTDLQNRLDTLMKDTYFCTYETVVQDIYFVNGQPRIDWRRSSNGVISSEPFGNGQEGREHNSFYLDGKAIMGVDNRPNISFYNTFYLYEKSPSSGHFQAVSFNGVIDFVSYSILHYDSNKGYPIICTQDRGDFNIAFRLKSYNADAMKDVVVHDRTYKTGYDRGRANGISEATQSGHIFESSTSFLKSIFTDMGKLLDIKVFGNVTVGTLIGIPLILLVVMAVLKLVRG
jgi:cell division protein FtsB